MEFQNKLFSREKLISLIEEYKKDGNEGYNRKFGDFNDKQKELLKRERIDEKLIQTDSPQKNMENLLSTLDKYLSDNKENLDFLDIGKKNYQRYLVIDDVDVYFATSMREDEDFKLIGNFINKVMNVSILKDLKLRYFDPTQAFTNDRIAKGLLEALMLKRTKVAVYYAWPGETFGKVSEASTMLVQGKPVIIFVPKFNVDEKDKYKRAERLAKNYKELHPLSLQVNIKNGVANGVIVVRKEAECSKVLYQLLTDNLETEIIEKEHNYLLVEKNTQSVIRVVTKDQLLTTAFWNYYKKNLFQKGGILG